MKDDVVKNDREIDTRLESLAERTRGIRPKPDFTGRVMQAVGMSPRRTWLDEIFVAAKRSLPIAALATCLAIGWAVQIDRSLDDALVDSYEIDTAELGW